MLFRWLFGVNLFAGMSSQILGENVWYLTEQYLNK